MNRTTRTFEFNNTGGERLSGVIDMPESTPRFFGVFAPCFTCVKESHGTVKICRALAENGIAMLRFDMTGIGDSDGDFAATNFSTRVGDILSACAALAKSTAAPKLLVGHSISGTAALSAAQYLPELEALATVGAPRDPAAVIDKFKNHGLMTVLDDTVELMVLGRKTVFKKSFLDDMLSQRVAEDTAKITRKLFIFHAPNDDIVSFENAREIYSRATTEDRELIPLDNEATHLFENRKDDAVFIAVTLSSWFQARGY